MSGARDLVHARPMLALKAATRALVDASGGGEGAAATIREALPHRVGQKQQRLSDAGLPNTEDFLTIDRAVALEEVTVGRPGWPHVTRAMCARAGGVFVPLPTLPLSADSLQAQVAELMRETGDVLTALGTAFADGTLNARESATITCEIDDVLSLLTRLRGAVQDEVRL